MGERHTISASKQKRDNVNGFYINFCIIFLFFLLLIDNSVLYPLTRWICTCNWHMSRIHEQYCRLFYNTARHPFDWIILTHFQGQMFEWYVSELFIFQIHLLSYGINCWIDCDFCNNILIIEIEYTINHRKRNNYKSI
jgi:hypothetical protein